MNDSNAASAKNSPSIFHQPPEQRRRHSPILVQQATQRTREARTGMANADHSGLHPSRRPHRHCRLHLRLHRPRWLQQDRPPSPPQDKAIYRLHDRRHALPLLLPHLRRRFPLHHDLQNARAGLPEVPAVEAGFRPHHAVLRRGGYDGRFRRDARAHDEEEASLGRRSDLHDRLLPGYDIPCFAASAVCEHRLVHCTGLGDEFDCLFSSSQVFETKILR